MRCFAFAGGFGYGFVRFEIDIEGAFGFRFLNWAAGMGSSRFRFWESVIVCRYGWLILARFRSFGFFGGRGRWGGLMNGGENVLGAGKAFSQGMGNKSI